MRETTTEKGADWDWRSPASFAEANGGRVWAESPPGGGAAFGLAFPMAQVPVEVGAVSGARVLVVDDEPQILRALETTLARRRV